MRLEEISFLHPDTCVTYHMDYRVK
jgi:hypothetical protein